MEYIMIEHKLIKVVNYKYDGDNALTHRPANIS